MSDILLDALLDVLKLLPFLFLTYLLLEWAEKRAEEGSVALVRRSGAWGPVIGAVVGVVPQCGFSAAAANLFAQRLISAGTLLAVFLSTSDEMLPILLSEAVRPSVILKILGSKLIIALAVGLFADRVLHLCRHEGEKVDLHEICERDHCRCEDRGVFAAAALHTLRIAGFILAVNLALGFVIRFVGQERLSGFILNRPVLGPLLSALVGLIPNCAASIIITELYLSGALSAGAMLSGLLTASGVGMLVLFRVNRRAMADNLKILAALYIAGAVFGVALDLLRVPF